MKNYFENGKCKKENEYNKKKKERYCYHCETAMIFKDEKGNIKGSCCIHLRDEKF